MRHTCDAKWLPVFCIVSGQYIYCDICRVDSIVTPPSSTPANSVRRNARRFAARDKNATRALSRPSNRHAIHGSPRPDRRRSAAIRRLANTKRDDMSNRIRSASPTTIEANLNGERRSGHNE